MKTFFVEEPQLFFKGGNPCIDPKVGLLNYGPNGLTEENSEIKVGLIGSPLSIKYAREFLERLKYNIPGQKKPDSNVRGIDFPGVDKNLDLGFYFTIQDEEKISDQDINSIIKQISPKERITKIALAFHQAIEDLSGIHPAPDLVIISLPEKILDHCKNPFLESDDIKLYSRTFEDLQKVAEMPVEERPLLFDLHDYLKVVGFEYKLKTQVIKPKTLRFESGTEDPATIAWNFVVANFYKSTGIPWKLADLEPETVHVGVSFYNDIGLQAVPVVRAAIAQVYMKTGDSQVIRGMEIPVQREEESRILNLTEGQAFDILDKAIALFRRQHDNMDPLRIVVHKKSPFTDNELNGFHKAAEGINIQDYLHISERPDLRVLANRKYPIMRGSVFVENEKEFYIFTTGYIPAFDTYPGSEVPRPLKISIAEPKSPISTLARDIMNLTKLDWNTASFAKHLPVTISVSQKVGDIMGELTISMKNLSLPTAYSNYM